MTWEMFGEASRVLSQMVADDYEPDMILSIARGGLLIGGAMGYALSVKNVYTMNVEFYTGVDERLEVPRILPPAPDFVDVSDARILIADDVADWWLGHHQGHELGDRIRPDDECSPTQAGLRERR